MPILYLKNNATTAKSVRPTDYTFPTGLNAVYSLIILASVNTRTLFTNTGSELCQFYS